MSDAYEGRYMTADDVRGLADLWKQYGVTMERMIAAEKSLAASREREAGLRSVIGVAIAGLEHTAAGDLGEVQYAISLLTDACEVRDE